MPKGYKNVLQETFGSKVAGYKGQSKVRIVNLVI